MTEDCSKPSDSTSLHIKILRYTISIVARHGPVRRYDGVKSRRSLYAVKCNSIKDSTINIHTATAINDFVFADLSGWPCFVVCNSFIKSRYRHKYEDNQF